MLVFVKFTLVGNLIQVAYSGFSFMQDWERFRRQLKEIAQNYLKELFMTLHAKKIYIFCQVGADKLFGKQRLKDFASSGHRGSWFIFHQKIIYS